MTHGFVMPTGGFFVRGYLPHCKILPEARSCRNSSPAFNFTAASTYELQPVAAMSNHAIENFEMLPGVGQQLRIRGVIRGLDRHDHRADLRMILA